MARFEVYVPEAPPGLPAALTLRVDAAHWLAALKAGLARFGLPAPPAHVLCDIKADGSVHVTDPASGRVFRIHELGADGSAEAPEEAATVSPSAVADRIEEVPAPAAPPPGRIGRVHAPVGGGAVLSELFEQAAGLSAARDRSAALALALDLALRFTDAEAGSAFSLEADTGDLLFEVARGPRAAEVLRLGMHIPMGLGLVGFCAQERVCVAVSDAEEHPRYFRGIAQAVGYPSHSVLCAPMQVEGELLGALQLLNRRGGQPFGPTDVTVLSYLASRAGEWMSRHG
ncbi:MAG TPA: GAF domain-containing protein [Anaeromyxobacteraceae bacterium]|nr:GAF domain-containing protein [Anaeromyxobacteraceae bacterium]